MDGDTEISDDDTFDYEHRFFDLSPISTTCQNEAIGVESFHTCFMRRYSSCPAFFIGSLQDACQAAFTPSAMEKSRPVLVYIHHDKNVFNDMICSKIFCSETLIQYLLENYIVWPWDITLESNRNRLIQIWEEIFPTQAFNSISDRPCSMFICIMRRSARNKNWSKSSEYEFTLLNKDDLLTGTDDKTACGIFLQELIGFKDKFDENEQDLSLNFQIKTGLSWEVILEICKYLRFTDALNAFSNNILSVLSECKSKLHLSYPSSCYLRMILQQIKPEQIVSLHLDETQFLTARLSNDDVILTDVISLTLDNFQEMTRINRCHELFPNLVRLSLRYDNQFNLYIFHNLFSYLPSSIEKFEIHCMRPYHIHNSYNQNGNKNTRNITIKHFLLVIGNYEESETNTCYHYSKSYSWKRIINLIKNMCALQRIQLVIHQTNLEEFLDLYEWKRLMHECRQLKKIILQVNEKMTQHQQLIQKIIMIQDKLRHIRETIQFQVISI